MDVGEDLLHLFIVEGFSECIATFRIGAVGSEGNGLCAMPVTGNEGAVRVVEGEAFTKLGEGLVEDCI